MLKDITTVIFDLDGTLVTSMWIWEEVDTIINKKYNLTPSKDFYHSMEGMSFTEVAHHYINAFNLNITVEELKKNWMDITYDLYANEVQIKHKVLDMLKHCKENKIKMGIASSCTLELIEAVLKQHNIRDYFGTIVTSCEVGKGKPAPDVYLKAAQNLGANPSHCMVFEDVPNGVLGGKAAGMKVCAIEDESNEIYRIKLKELAHYYICHYGDVLEGNYEVLENE